MKKYALKLCDIFLVFLLIWLSLFLLLLLSPVLILSINASRKRKKKSTGNQLLMLAEAATYDALKAKGNLSALKLHICSGYFKKVFIIHNLARENKVIPITDQLELIEFRTFMKPLKRLNFIFTYTLVNSLYYFVKIFKLMNFAKENASVIRGAGVHHTALGALFLGYLTRLPVCISVHSDDDKRYHLMKGSGAFWRLFGSRKITVFVHKFVFSRAPRILLIRESLIPWAIKMGASLDRIRVIPHGIDIKNFFQSYDGDIKLKYGLSSKKVVLFAGRLSEDNFVYDIIEIAKKVAHILDVFIVIIGDGPERDKLVRLTEAKGLSTHVKFLGALPLNEVYEFRKSADVNLCLRGGFSLIEAMLSKKPVIAYDVDWHYEVIKNKETGFLISEHDVETAGETVVTLLKNPDLARQMGERACELAIKRHDVTQTDRVKMDVYEELKKMNKLF